MARLPAMNPSIPYLGLISGGLQHGSMIRITGQMQHGDRFNISIQTGAAISPSDDINLHISVRPFENVIALNHKTRHVWGFEEKHGGCPIKQGAPFSMLILAEHNAFKVAVNGVHFCEFPHRLPLSTARFIHIEGGVMISSIVVEGDSPPATAPPLPSIYPDLHRPAPPAYQQPLYQQPPYQHPTYQHQLPHQQPPYQQTPYHMPAYPQPQNPYGSGISSATYAMPSGNTLSQLPIPHHNQIGHHHQHVYSTTTHHPTQYVQPQQSQYQYQPSHLETSNQQYFQPKKNKNNALKYAAGIGGIGLGAYALSKVFSEDCSDSD